MNLRNGRHVSILALWMCALPEAHVGAQERAETPREVNRPVFTLERCVAFAVDHNRQLLDERLQLEVASKQVREAWGSVFPSIDATLTYTRNLTDQNTFIPEFFVNPDADPNSLIEVRFAGENLWNTRLSLEQPLFQAEAFIGVGAASRFKTLQTERVRGRAHQVVTEVRGNFLQTLLAQENVRLIGESIRRVRETLENAIGMQQAGLASSYDVLRLQVELGKLEPNLRRAQNDLEAAERNLKIAMGLDVREPLSVAGSLASLDLEDEPGNARENAELLRFAGVRVRDDSQLPELMQLAASRRSELLQARLDTKLAEAQLSAERATVYPKLVGFANYTVDAQEDGSPDFFGENDAQRTSNWQAGVRLEVPVFEGGARYSRMAQRSVQVDQRRTREKQVGEQIHNEIQTLLAQILEARERVQAQKRAVAQAQRGFEIASAEFREGLGERLNVTDAEVALRETEFNYAEAVFDVLRTQAELDAAIGVVPMVDVIEVKP